MSAPFDLSKCAICQKNRKPDRFALCIKCAKEHETLGKPFSVWPDWIKFLANEHRKWRERKLSKYYMEEIPYDPRHLERLIENEQEEYLP